MISENWAVVCFKVNRSSDSCSPEPSDKRKKGTEIPARNPRIKAAVAVSLNQHTPIRLRCSFWLPFQTRDQQEGMCVFFPFFSSGFPVKKKTRKGGNRVTSSEESARGKRLLSPRLVEAQRPEVGLPALGLRHSPSAPLHRLRRRLCGECGKRKGKKLRRYPQQHPSWARDKGPPSQRKKGFKDQVLLARKLGWNRSHQRARKPVPIKVLQLTHEVGCWQENNNGK